MRTNATLRRLEPARTKANTGFTAWHHALDRLLVESSLPTASRDEAHGFYETGHSPEAAVREIAAR